MLKREDQDIVSFNVEVFYKPTNINRCNLFSMKQKLKIFIF